jgi:uncharacterized membrane protein
MRILFELSRARRGGVALMTAISLGAVLGFAAMAIDLGSIFLQTRQLQGIADLAAIGAANDLTNAQAAAAGTAGANNWPGAVQTTTVVGTYVADPTVAANQRFTPGGVAPNAAKVTLTAPANLFFGAPILGRTTINISRSATAANAQMAAFSVGSGLLALQGGVANSLLSALTGSQVSLSVMDYNALASANVDLLQYSQALQTNLNMQGVSFNQVLASNVTTGQALQVLANQLDTNGQDPAAQAIRQIAAAAGNATPAQLSQLINLGPYGGQDGADPATGAGVQVNALQMVDAMLQLSQGGRQVQLSLGANVPGLTSVSAWLAIGQRPSNSPWLTVTDDGSPVISTVQTRLYLVAQVAPGAGALSSAGVGLVNIPIFVQIASAQAKLSAITCATPTTAESVTLAAQPSIGELALGQVDTSKLNDFTTPMTISAANLISLPLISATGQAQVNIGGQDWQTVSFSQADIQADTEKTVTTNDIVQATISSLLSNLNIQVQVVGLNLGLGGVLSPALQSTLSTAAAPLDSTLNALTALLGVQLGQADLWVNGVRCNNAALVA